MPTTDPETAPAPAVIDARPIAPLQRHAQVVRAFRSLRDGQSIDLLNDHDMTPLRWRFQSEQPGAAPWDDLETGPQVWRSRITRLPAGRGGACCGACGGA